jgi:hypothetical protein
MLWFGRKKGKQIKPPLLKKLLQQFGAAEEYKKPDQTFYKEKQEPRNP